MLKYESAIEERWCFSWSNRKCLVVGGSRLPQGVTGLGVGHSFISRLANYLPYYLSSQTPRASI